MNQVILTGELRMLDLQSNKYYFQIRTQRKSGVYDITNIEWQYDGKQQLYECAHVVVFGEFRSRNYVDATGKNHLQLYVHAQHVQVDYDKHPMNDIELVGYIVQTPTYRLTPLGREICNLLIAVHREGNTIISDYLPLITWEGVAKAINKLEVGQKIYIHGRIQSREYEKVIGDKTEIRTTYEVSVHHFKVLKGGKQAC